MRRELGSNMAREKPLLVVSNSSVIIALAKVCRLRLLEELFNDIFVPEAVWTEITAGGKPGSRKIERAKFIHVEEVSDRRLVALLEEFVDAGEAEAIVLALERRADLLLVDGHDARSLAKSWDYR